MNPRRSIRSTGRLAAVVGFLLGLALGCGGGGGGGGCGVSNEQFCLNNCLPGQNVYGCDIPTTNDRVCAIDDAMALLQCPPNSNAKFLAQCPAAPMPGTGGPGGGDGADGAQGGTGSTLPPGVDESADGDAKAAGKP